MCVPEQCYVYVLQHYMYELLNGGKDTEKCPRQVCPFAIVAFSYEKAEPAVPESSEKR